MSHTSELAVVRAGLMILGTLLTACCASSLELKSTLPDCVFNPAQSLGSIVNSAKFDGSPTVSADESSLFFTSGRDGQQDIFVSIRPSKDAPWNPAVNLGELVNDPVADDFSLRLSADGKTLYFASNRRGG